jgi:hypothetical protein
MSDLTWRIADVQLKDKLIPDPNAGHIFLNSLHNVYVALDNGFLHIDPQRGKTEYPNQSEWSAYIVPAGAVDKLHYRIAADDPQIPTIH